MTLFGKTRSCCARFTKRSLVVAGICLGLAGLINSDVAWAQSPVQQRVARWHDAKTGRYVLARIHVPSNEGAIAPVIILSHGLGRSGKEFDFLARTWAGRGFLVICPEHVGSNTDVWRGKLFPRNALRSVYARCAHGKDRVRDVQAVLNVLQGPNVPHELSGVEFDANRVGVAGNDLGALAGLLLGGQLSHSGESLRDPRVTAVVAMSPPVAHAGPSHSVRYGGVEVPCLFITGTQDDGVVGPTRSWQRRIPFDHITRADAYLMTLFGADHMVYAGHLLPRRAQADRVYHQAIAKASTHFWQAYLLGDHLARGQMRTGDFSVSCRLSKNETRLALPTGIALEIAPPERTPR